MVYNKTAWKDRVVERPLTFTLQNNADGTVTLVPAEGQIIEPGTSINAVNMNNLEKQYDEAVAWTKGYGLGTTAVPIGDADSIIETGFYNYSGTTLNIPSGMTGGTIIHIKRDGRHTQTLHEYTSNRMFIRSLLPTIPVSWSAWQELLQDKAPSWIGMTLQNGITAAAGFAMKYTKIGKIVFVSGQLVAPPNNTVFFTMPAGYRPSRIIYKTVSPNSGSAGAIATLAIDHAGTMRILTQSPATNIFVEVSWIAEQ